MKRWSQCWVLLVLSIVLVSCGQQANSSTESKSAQAKSERLAQAKSKRQALKKAAARKKRHAKAVSGAQAKQVADTSKQSRVASSQAQVSEQQTTTRGSATRQVAASQNQQPSQPQKQTQAAPQQATNQPQANRTDPNTWNLPYRGYPSYNAYCEANNGDPDVQRETNDIQTQWAIKNGIMNPDGTLTPKGQAQANATE